MRAIGQPKMLASKITDAKSTNGEEIKKEKVIPIGNPARVKPIKIGIEEQVQNGVNVPISAPMVLPAMP
jgi:hypothetical protein